MSGERSGSPPWNRIVTNPGEDLARPEYRGATASLAAVAARYAALGRPLRADFARDWENAHVLTAFDRLVRESQVARPLRSVLDLGGGNSAVAYLLAERGFQTVVADADRAVVDTIRRNGRELQWAERLTAVCPNRGLLPFLDASFDCVLCISVFEGVLRRDRPQFWSEIRRTLRPGRSLLLTFDFGAEARFVGDPPVTVQEIETEIVAPSGLVLVGSKPEVPCWDPVLGPPVRTTVPAVDGSGSRAIAYSFGAVHLRRPG